VSDIRLSTNWKFAYGVIKMIRQGGTVLLFGQKIIKIKLAKLEKLAQFAVQRDLPMKHENSKLVYSTDPELRRKIEEQQKSASKPEAINLPPEKQQIKISLQTKGRKGKQVTLIQGFQHDASTLNDLAGKLKRFCSAGGTVKGQDIEIQGDNRTTIAEKLRRLGYKVKK